MCGIFGAVGSYYNGAKTLDLNLISHRGPDAKDYFDFKDNKVLLGHTRLAIIDINDRANQPMHSSCGRFVIIYNGEIFNYLELKSELEKIGVFFNTKSDTEVILNGFIEFGYNFFSKLNGMFAICIHDKTKNKTIILRDEKGIKPLYIKSTIDGILFSSEIKPILSYKNEKPTFNEDALVRHLAYNFSPGSKTLFKGINKVEPGTIINFYKNKFEINKIKNFKNSSFKKVHFKKIKQELDEHLNLAIKKQTISDAKLGCFLSGGLDSSTIVYYASKNRPDIETFCIKGDWEEKTPEESDLLHANSVAKFLNVKLNHVEVSSENFFTNLPSMISSLEEPISDPAAISTYLISKSAKDKGIKVLLSGIGGDEAFAGYRRHMIGRYFSIISSMPFEIGLKLVKKVNTLTKSSFFSRRFKRFLNISDYKESVEFIKLFQWQEAGTLQNILATRFHKYTNSKFFKDSLQYDSRGCQNYLRQMMQVDNKYFLPDHNLTYSDKMSMACGVEVRVPLIDKELTDYIQKLPNNYLWRWTQGKWILKKTMEEYLPKNIIYRKKVGFGLPLHTWIRESKHSFIYDNLKSKKFIDRSIFDKKSIDDLIFKSKQGIEEASLLLFSIQCIDLWFDIFIDQK